MNDLYAFCRLADDISDLEDLHLSPKARVQHLDRIANWIRAPKALGHPYWDRFQQQMNEYKYPQAALLGILDGVRFDLERKPMRISTWTELNAYVEGVAVCVGELVLAIQGLSGERARIYAQNMGRCLQYLNIMRDIDEDFKSNRIYLPEEALTEWGASERMRSGIERPSEELKTRARAELYQRAMQFRQDAVPYSSKCLIAELIAGVYLEGAEKYWRKGDSRRLTSLEKAGSVSKVLLRFLFRVN